MFKATGDSSNLEINFKIIIFRTSVLLCLHLTLVFRTAKNWSPNLQAPPPLP